jgi:hypothetical protein
MKRMALLGAIVAVAGVGVVVGWALTRPSEEACGSGAVDRGNGWQEMGGPTAFLLYDPPYFGPVTARMAWVRIAAPTDGRSLTVEVRERSGSGLGSGTIQSQGLPPSAFDMTVRPSSHLPGMMHFVVLDVPSAGCWTLDFAIGGEPAGSAAIPVVPWPTGS